MILIIFLSSLLMSCATVDVERNVRSSRAASTGQIGESFPSFRVEPEIVERERPVFVPEKEVPRAALSGYDAVHESNRVGIVRPSDYSHAAMVYDYDPDWVYEIYAQPLRAVDIALEPGEQATEAPFISDSVRWQVGAGLSYSRGIPVQHIYIKPAEAAISASLIINTDRRVYNIILRSYQNVFMPIVRWRYFPSAMPQNYISAPAGRDGAEPGPAADPRFLSFNYRITHSLFRRPAWLPDLVFDDGSKTYIAFPGSVLQRELPAVFENRHDVLNYRVLDNLVVIDKLVESITVKIGREEIAIAKKRGRNGR
jgi:type IV secretion system protein VirB9